MDPQHWSIAWIGYLDTVSCFDMIDYRYFEVFERYFEDYDYEKDDTNLPVRPWGMVDGMVWCFDMIDYRYFEDSEDEKDDKNLPRWECE